jgi:hypothetical protein
MFTEIWFGSMIGPMGFIIRKLGQDAQEELNEKVAKSCSNEMKGRGVDDA